jgi:hypothetical protein
VRPIASRENRSQSSIRSCAGHRASDPLRREVILERDLVALEDALEADPFNR